MFRDFHQKVRSSRQAAGTVQACLRFVLSCFMRVPMCLYLPTWLVRWLIQTAVIVSICVQLCERRFQLSCIIHALACALLHSLMSQFTKKKNVLGWQEEREGEKTRKRVLLGVLVFNQVSRAACATAEHLSAVYGRGIDPPLSTALKALLTNPTSFCSTEMIEKKSLKHSLNVILYTYKISWK